MICEPFFVTTAASSQTGSEYGLSAVDEDAEETEATKRVMRNKLLEIATSLSTLRGDMRGAVFKPSHILPRYTVEQAGMIELEEVCSCEMILALRPVPASYLITCMQLY